MRRKFVESTENILIPIYEESLVIEFTNNIPKSVRKHGISSKGHSRTNAIVIPGEDSGEIICIFEYPVSPNTAAHEAWHITEDILESRQISAKGEPAAYLVGFITQQILEAGERVKKIFS